MISIKFMETPKPNEHVRFYIKYKTHHYPFVREGIFLGEEPKIRGKESGLSYRLRVDKTGVVLGLTVFVDDVKRPYEATYFKKNIVGIQSSS
jgi:hypothetical protein